ncbi:heavy-metal-associated domain-containing protein [Georgenia sp. SYP-B2076]|uniref:heavy-metal-associated domain-containing protein n=1 Tax=Georgenia sp. SYP-B2076 TaxID=2495881 RepID=UPI000F8E2317|nr:heavy-metal-associated domain-containing protein [Georgenia sp. SYP-B2076]
MMRHTPRAFVGTTTFEVTGMTCGHCADALVGVIRALPGIAAIAVDLTSGVVTVTAAEPVDRADIADAIDTTGHHPH